MLMLPLLSVAIDGAVTVSFRFTFLRFLLTLMLLSVFVVFSVDILFSFLRCWCCFSFCIVNFSSVSVFRFLRIRHSIYKNTRLLITNKIKELYINKSIKTIFLVISLTSKTDDNLEIMSKDIRKHHDKDVLKTAIWQSWSTACKWACGLSNPGFGTPLNNSTLCCTSNRI